MQAGVKLPISGAFKCMYIQASEYVRVLQVLPAA